MATLHEKHRYSSYRTSVVFPDAVLEVVIEKYFFVQKRTCPTPHEFILSGTNPFLRGRKMVEFDSEGWVPLVGPKL